MSSTWRMSQETVSQSQMTIDGVIYTYFVSYALQNNSFVRIAKFDLIDEIQTVILKHILVQDVLKKAIRIEWV
jgi:hypothetical protein